MQARRPALFRILNKLSGRKVDRRMRNNIVFFICFLAGLLVHAQNDSIVNPLEEVVVLADRNIKENSIGLKVVSLKDSVIQNNRESFTNLIKFTAPIYLKEYGAGGTSTASFRGTSSSNTAVIWNGININSVNSGVTDFNSLSVNLIDDINIRSGGGSIRYGSGAIGGTIHLNTELSFDKHISNQIVTSIGSYSTYQGLYKTSYASSIFAIKAGVSYNQSENDYPWLRTEYTNTNGAYQNINWNISSALKLSDFSKLKFYYTSYLAERHFSGELPNPTEADDKYKDFNTRSLLVFENIYNQFRHEFKLAYLTQEYNYYDNKASESFDFGKSETFLVNYDFTYNLNNNIKIDSYSEYSSIIGSTSTNADPIVNNRIQYSQSFVFSQNVEKLFSYNLKVRQDFNSDYSVPFVMALGAEVPLVKNLVLRLNASTNYRVPTYNDLYWPGQGNENLIPESSKQGEVGLTFSLRKTKIDLAYYSIESKDKIIWTPSGDVNRPGIWVPVNLDETKNTGFEIRVFQHVNYKQHYFDFNTNYSYTVAKNTKTDQFLIFVPKHLLNFNLGYSYKRWSAFYQFLFNGKVYTSEDNLDILSLPSYDISNIGIDYHLLQSEQNNLTLGLKVNNIYNEIYKITLSRPMPNRNFNIHINYKF